MPRRAGSATVRLLAASATLLGLLCAAHSGAVRAEDGVASLVEVSGRISPEVRLYPVDPAFPDQRRHASGLAVETTLYVEDDEGTSVTVTPFFRYDAGDPGRTHADLREAFLLAYGDLGEGEWELRLGVDRVFWGVVESRSLVDIINQSDVLEDHTEKTKLGQPMAHFTWSGDWGELEAFALTGHRPRRFPGRHGRLRPGAVHRPGPDILRGRVGRVACRPGHPVYRHLRPAERRPEPV